MPKIQDMIGQRGIQVGGGIASGKTGQVEGAIANLGNTVETIGQRIQEREDKLGYIKAKSEFLKKKTEADSAFMGDEDYKTFVPRYSEAMNKARDESLQSIRHPDLKAQFEADAGLDIQQGLSRTAQLAWMKEKEYGKAGVINVLSQNREAFLRAGDEATRAAIINNDLDTIHTARDIGYIPADDAEAMRIKRTEDLAQSFIETKDPNMQLQLLQEKGGYADYIPSDKRKAMQDRAQAQIATQQLLLEKQRKLAVQQAHIEALDSIDRNGSLQGIPANAWSAMDAKQRKGLLDYSKAVASGSYIATDYVGTYYPLVAMANNPAQKAEFAQMDLAEHRMKLGNSEFKELVKLQGDINEGKGKGADNPAFLSILTDKQAVDNALKNLTGKANSSKYDDDDREFANAFYRVVNDEMRVWMDNNPGNKKVPPAERDKIIDKLTDKSFTKVETMFGVDAFWPDADATVLEEIRSDLKRAGKPVTAYTVFSTYQKAKAAGIIE